MSEARRPLTLADGLALAASPTFAVMAVATGLAGGGSAMVCGVVPASPLGGMAAMYALMSAFHAGPWLRRLRRG